MYLRRITHDGGAARIQPLLDYDTARQFCREQRECLPRDLLDMHGDPLADSAAAERENSIHQCPSALAGDHDVFHVAPQSAARGYVAERHLPIAKNRATQVVDGMRDSAR